MTRLKGQRPRSVQLDHYTDAHPVAHMIATGTHWLQAWLVQKSTPLARLARTTGIPVERLTSIRPGTEVSHAELDALARAWSVSTADLIRSVGEANPVIE